jgi:hypothetical protein
LNAVADMARGIIAPPAGAAGMLALFKRYAAAGRA